MCNETLSSYFYMVEIDGIQTTRFLECYGLEMGFSVFEVEEGGLNTSTHKFKSHNRYPNLVLKKGVNNNNELLKWYQKNINGNFERKNISVILMDSSLGEIKRWNLFGAFPCRWKGPSLDVYDNKYAIEMIEIAYE
ncbi:MAG: phage tail protein [Treponema sp.]|nr:phage tail protein [Treponema sp.]